jgi:hypothetical protein
MKIQVLGGEACSGSSGKERNGYVTLCVAQSACASLLVQKRPQKYTVHGHAILVVFRRKSNKSYVEYETFWLTILTSLCEITGLENIPEQSTICREEHRLKKYLGQAGIELIQSVFARQTFCRRRWYWFNFCEWRQIM